MLDKHTDNAFSLEVGRDVDINLFIYIYRRHRYRYHLLNCRLEPVEIDVTRQMRYSILLM